MLDENPLTTENADDGTVYREYAAMVNGEETTVTLKGTNRDNVVSGANFIRENTLYRIETITPDGDVTEVSRVTKWNASNQETAITIADIAAQRHEFSLIYSDTTNVPVYSGSGTIRVEQDSNISESDNNIAVNYTNERMYAYDNETIFVEVTLDEDGDVVGCGPLLRGCDQRQERRPRWQQQRVRAGRGRHQLPDAHCHPDVHCQPG